MKFLAEEVSQIVVAGRDGLALSLDMLAQLRPAGGAEPVAQLCSYSLLDERQCVVGLHRFLHARAGNEGAPVALNLHQAIIGEADQRLANDDAADAEDFGKLTLSQFAPRDQPVIDDTPGQHISDRL